MKQLTYAVFIVLGCLLLSATNKVEATASLQVTPLKYQAVLHPGAPQRGLLTVANPTDSVVTVQSEVQSVRQIGDDGQLQFYDDPAINQGIVVSRDVVSIPARQSVNFAFQINPDQLPQRGVYAVIFFRTQPAQTGDRTQVIQSLRVGTLLLLQNGTTGTKRGTILSLDVPKILIGNGATGQVLYKNTGTVALNPHLQFQTASATHIVDGPYILPDSQRTFSFRLTGSHLGLVTLKLVDPVSHSVVSGQVWAVTGIWVWLLPVCLALAIGLLMIGVTFFRQRRPLRYRAR